MAAGTIAPDTDAFDNPAPPTLGPTAGAPAPIAGTPSQPAAPGAGATPPLSGPPTPGGIATSSNGKGEIPTPNVKLKFDNDKLAKAQTTLDVLNAATATSRQKYMDWWQKTHGDIDEKYDNMKQQLGARPSDDEPQTQKEKFAALLEFGLHLMKNSAAATTNQGAVTTSTLSDEHDAMDKAHQDNIANSQKDYDTQAQGIEDQRNKEQAGIGTPAQAMKASSDQAATDAKTVKAQTGALKDINDVDTIKQSSLGAPTYATGPGGVIHSIARDADGTAHATPVTGIDGKPFAGKVLGKEAGSGIDKSSQDPAAVRTYKYATSVVGISPEVAKGILGIKASGNPNADHASVYKSVMSATLGDTEKAKRVADQYVLDSYGAGALAKANAPAVPDQPPATALTGLKPGDGKMLDFGAKGKWTLGIDGKPLKVPDNAIAGGAPQTIQ
jgi:hypothetical protein